MSIPIYLDIHTHTIASGHATADTITDMARSAHAASLQILGISDHGPATIGAGRSSYFRNLLFANRKRFDISLLYGVELNILDTNGNVDLEDSLIEALDYAIISMHHPIFKSGSASSNTQAYIRAMQHPGVRFLGHPDDGKFPVDYKQLLTAAREYHVYPEINNASLMPDSYRKNCHENCRILLSLCKEMQLPILLSSDSHGKKHVGNMRYILPLLEECNFPQHLIINSNLSLFHQIIRK